MTLGPAAGERQAGVEQAPGTARHAAISTAGWITSATVRSARSAPAHGNGA